MFMKFWRFLGDISDIGNKSGVPINENIVQIVSVRFLSALNGYNV